MIIITHLLKVVKEEYLWPFIKNCFNFIHASLNRFLRANHDSNYFIIYWRISITVYLVLRIIFVISTIKHILSIKFLIKHIYCSFCQLHSYKGTLLPFSLIHRKYLYVRGSIKLAKDFIYRVDKEIMTCYFVLCS